VSAMTSTERLDEWMWLIDGGVDPTAAAGRVGARLDSLRRAAVRSNHEAALRRLDMIGVRLADETAQRRSAISRGERPMVATRLTTTKALAACGTAAGEARHRYRGEPICDACRHARRKPASTLRKAGPRARPQAELCGTASGARTHRRRGTEVCERCREAARVAERLRYRTHHTIERRSAA